MRCLLISSAVIGVIAARVVSSGSCDVKHMKAVQAPVDIKRPVRSATEAAFRFVKGPEFDLKYSDEKNVLVENTGVLIKVSGFSKSRMRYRTTTYKLEEIRFYKASETKINGKGFVFEAHLIHRHKLRGVVAVSVLFIAVDRRTSFLDSLNWGGLRVKGAEMRRDIASAQTMLSPFGTITYYTYPGAAPCAQHWRWIVLEHSSAISRATLDGFPLSGNNRPTLPLKNRTVELVYNKVFQTFDSRRFVLTEAPLVPTAGPTLEPTRTPTANPTAPPTTTPTERPTLHAAEPQDAPGTDVPTETPTHPPTTIPTMLPSITPTRAPTDDPSETPSGRPSTSEPSQNTTRGPTANPTSAPTRTPTERPTASNQLRSDSPTELPSEAPSMTPTMPPSAWPTTLPTTKPTPAPSRTPTEQPTATPTKLPSEAPTATPTMGPSTARPTGQPTAGPTDNPTVLGATNEPTTFQVNTALPTAAPLQPLPL